MAGPTVTEAQIQRSIVQLLSALAQQNDFLFFSIPNESLNKLISGKISRKWAAIIMNILKGLGLLPGASDLEIVHNGRAYFAEVKKPKGTQSLNQKLFERRAIECGAEYVIVRDPQDMLNALKNWHIIA